ncbi:PAS domain S-box protein [Aeromonas dhakensis]|uniref:PAS domain S-box protein n=1 Tax=Aeromonas dhakensis TaxID=196024 RepID=UPI0039869E60
MRNHHPFLGLNRSAGLVLLIGLLLSLLGTLLLHYSNDKQVQASITAATEHVADTVKARLDLYQYGLRGVRGAILTAGEHAFDNEDFVRYSLTRDVDSEFPGARGFGFIRRVKDAELDDFIQRARRDGRPGFTLQLLSPYRGEHFIIQFIEPLSRNKAAIGLDIASEPSRREAALAAIRSGEVRLTPPITLVQATGKPRQSFLMLMPIYRTVTTPATPEEREAAGFGWSYTPLLMEELLDALHLESPAFHIRLIDVTDPRHIQPFYTSAIDHESRNPHHITMSRAAEREIHGRRWQIRLDAHPLFVAQLNQTSPYVVLFTGGLFTLLLTLLARMRAQGQQQRLQLIEEQARLAAIVASASDGIIAKTLNGVIVSWNKGAEDLFGYPAGEALTRTDSELFQTDHDSASEKALLADLRQGVRIPSFSARRRHRDGHLLDLSISIAPIYDHRGKLVGTSETIRDITAQKQAEAKILELNANLEHQVAERTAELSKINVLLSNVLRSASAISIIAADLEGTITLFNEGAEQLLGYSAADVVGKETPGIFHTRDEMQARSVELSAQYGEQISGFQVFVYKPEREGAESREWTYVRKDGSRFPVTLVITAIRDEQGISRGYLGIGLDITDSKAAEKKLAESLEITRAILDTAVNPIMTMDPDGRIHSLNPAGQTAFGYQAGEIQGRQVQTLLQSSDEHALGEAPLGALSDSQLAALMEREFIGRRRDGSEFPLQMSIGRMQAAGSSMFVCIMTDMTQQLAQRNEILSTRDQLQMAADVAELGIWSWELGSNALSWNNRMFELYDLPLTLREEGLNYQHWANRVHPDDLAATTASLNRAVAGTGIYDPVFRVMQDNGDHRVIQAGAKVERDSSGQALRVIGFNRDITAQTELESRLLYAKEQADAASQTKSSFLANMSHEIRTPLNAVLGMLQLIQYTELTARQLDYVVKAHSAANSLLGLLNDILDYSKIEASKLQLDLHPFDIELLMRDLAIVLDGNQRQKEIEVMFDIDPHLPNLLIGDSMRLQQVLTNLAGNALKFTIKGQVVITMALLARHEQTVTIRVAVTDSGIGISAHQLERIFESFTQAEASTTRRFGGSGLGLVICKRLLKLMGAELRVESEPGRGSRFWFDITLAQAAPQSLKEACPDMAPPPYILVVDDSELAAELLQRTLLQLGWQAELVHSGAEAVRRVGEARALGRPFDIVLMDWSMPGMDGLNAAAQIRQQAGQDPAPGVIMVTAYGHEVFTESHQSGATPFVSLLTKPVTPKQLAEAIYQALNGQDVAPALPAQHTRRLSGLTLLVVEDNLLNRQVACELLSCEGARVLLAECGRDGVAMVLQQAPSFDAVLIDMQMPDIDGLEATRQIRAHPQFANLPIIAMTANASEADRQLCLAAGMNEHVGKPIALEQLVSTLLAQLGKAGQPALAQPPSPAASEALLEAESVIRQRFDNDIELLQRILGLFGPDMAEQLEALHQAIAAGQVTEACRILHAIKGSASTMGACRLATLAKAQEQALLHADQSQAAALLADAGWQQLLEETVRLSLESLDKTFAPPPDTTAPPADDALSLAEWREAMQRILTLLEDGNLAAVELTEALAPKTPPQLHAAFHQFAGLIENLEFDAALKLGKSLCVNQ